MSGRFSHKKMTIFNISTKQIVVVLMAWSRTANAINLLEMAGGKICLTNNVLNIKYFNILVDIEYLVMKIKNYRKTMSR
jgi:hypothetical protein